MLFALSLRADAKRGVNLLFLPLLALSSHLKSQRLPVRSVVGYGSSLVRALLLCLSQIKKNMV